MLEAPKIIDVAAINTEAKIALLTNDEIVPITDFYGTDGVECEKSEALACVAGRDGLWFSIILSQFEGVRLN